MAIALEMWNGSVWVTVTVGTSPMSGTTGATRAAIATASTVGRPPAAGGASESASATRSTPARAASRACAT